MLATLGAAGADVVQSRKASELATSSGHHVLDKLCRCIWPSAVLQMHSRCPVAELGAPGRVALLAFGRSVMVNVLHTFDVGVGGQHAARVC